MVWRACHQPINYDEQFVHGVAGMLSHFLDFLDLLSQYLQALLNRFLEPESNLADGPEGSPDEIWVSFRDVLFELVQHRLVVLVVHDPNEYFAELHYSYIF